MMWPWTRSAPKPSAAAQQSIVTGRQELEEAKEIRRESARIGNDLSKVHERNHIAMSLESAIRRITA